MSTTKADSYHSTLRARIHEDFEREKWGIAAHDALAKVLANWKGKKLNKRVATQFAETLMPDPEAREKAVVRWAADFGMYQVEMWGVGPFTDHSKRLIMFVAYDTQPTEPKLLGAYVNDYDPASFERADCCHGNAAKERQEERIKLLQSGDLTEISNAINQAAEAYAKFSALIQHGTPGQQIRYFAQELLEAQCKD